MHTFLCLEQHVGGNQKQAVPLPTRGTTHANQHMHTAEPSLNSAHFTIFAFFLMAVGSQGAVTLRGSQHFPGKIRPCRPTTCRPALCFLISPGTQSSHRASHSVCPTQPLLPTSSCLGTCVSKPLLPLQHQEPDCTHTHWSPSRG